MVLFYFLFLIDNIPKLNGIRLLCDTVKQYAFSSADYDMEMKKYFYKLTNYGIVIQTFTKEIYFDCEPLLLISIPDEDTEIQESNEIVLEGFHKAHHIAIGFENEAIQIQYVICDNCGNYIYGNTTIGNKIACQCHFNDVEMD